MKTLVLFLTTLILSPTFCPFIENVINDELQFEIIMPADGYVKEEAYAIRPPTSNNVEAIPFTMEDVVNWGLTKITTNCYTGIMHCFGG